MTRFLKKLILLPIGKPAPVTCSEAGKRGAAVRIARDRAPILAMANRLNAEMGRPQDPRLGAM